MTLNPNTLAGKVLWLRAKDLSGAAGSTVSSWADQSGASHDPTINTTTITGAQRGPLTVAAASTPSGGKSARSDYAGIALPNLGLGSGGGEMWIVVKSDGGADAAAQSWKFGTQGGGDAYNYYPYSGVIYDDFGTDTRRSFTPTLSITTWRIYRVGITSAGGWFAHIDGVSQATVSGATIAWASAPAVSKRNTTTDVGGLKGNIAEVLVRSQVSTSDEVAWLIDYFNHEHGLSVAGGVDPSSPINLSATRATATAQAPVPKPNLFLLAPKATATALALTATLTFGAAPLPFNTPAATATATAPAPGMVVGPFGFAALAATATAAAPAPAIAFGAFEFHPPAATATALGVTPSINVAGSPLELAAPPATATASAPAPGLAIPVVARPWTRDMSRRTLMPFVTSGSATFTPPLASPPPGVVERTVWRRSRVVPDLRTIEGVEVNPDDNQLHLPAPLYFALPSTDEEVGVPHLIFHHKGKVVDATYFRGAITKILTDRREEPFGDATLSFEFPTVSSLDSVPDDPDHPLWFMINRANVQIELIKSDGTSRIVWTGHVVAHNTGNSEKSPNKTLQCVGSLFQASTDKVQPPPFLDPTDSGTLISRVLNAVTSRRYPRIAAVFTNIPSRNRGSSQDSPLAHVQALLAKMWTNTGRQWTVAKVEGSRRSYEVRLKKTEPEWTVTNGAHGVSVSLSRDGASIRNVIRGHGVGPNGSAWANTFYPNLHLADPPAFPFTNPDAVITVGTTDADTDSGDGVTVWQQRAIDLGYTVALDHVFNASDAKVARIIQRRFGITQDGIVGGQTWTAMFVTGANSGDLSGVIRLPLAADPRTQRYLYNADGSKAGLNPEFDPNVLIYADDVDFGTGITREEGIASAQQIVDRESEPGLTGRIVLTQDPREGSRMLIPPGDKITLIGYEGYNPVLHISAIERDWQTGTVTLEVDEKSRDAMTLAEIRTRNKEARRDPARRKGNPNKRSRLDVDQVVRFDGESGAGRIPRHPINGGLWNVYPLPVSELGRVAEMEIKCTAPFALVLLGAPTTAAHMHAWVGNPFLSSSPYKAHKRELDEHWIIDGFGQKGQRCGWFPGAEDGVDEDTGLPDPFTGVEQMSGFSFKSKRGPWLWVAEYAAESCFIEGYIKPDEVI